jgi:hypothetical protein
MNLRDIIKHVIQSRAEHPAQQGGFQDAPYRPGAPETGAGVYGRAGGVAPGMPMKPIAGLQSGMGGPVTSRNYGPEVSGTPTPAPQQPMTQAMPAPPPGAISQALRAGPPEPSAGMAPPTAPPMQMAQAVPFKEPPLDPGTPLPPDDTHEGSNPQLAPMEQMDPEGGQQAEGEEGPINLGVLPGITLGGPPEEEEAELKRMTEEIIKRMLQHGH